MHRNNNKNPTSFDYPINTFFRGVWVSLFEVFLSWSKLLTQKKKRKWYSLFNSEVIPKNMYEMFGETVKIPNNDRSIILFKFLKLLGGTSSIYTLFCSGFKSATFGLFKDKQSC